MRSPAPPQLTAAPALPLPAPATALPAALLAFAGVRKVVASAPPSVALILFSRWPSAGEVGAAL